MGNKCDDPHFIANFHVLSDEKDKSNNDGFMFPEDGVKVVPTKIDGSSNSATIGIFYKPNCVVPNGECFSAPCKVLAPEYWAGFIEKGFKFSVWGFASAVEVEVIEIFPENWKEVDFK